MRRFAVGTCLLFSMAAAAQTRGSAPAKAASAPVAGAIASQPEWPKAKAADVDSVEHILAALYDVISGPALQPRDWVRMRTLFVPGARLIPVRATGDAADVALLSIDDYIARSSGRMESSGFFEKATHNEVAQFGDLVHVFSTYESRHAQDDATPFARGINSIQLLKDGSRYWIVNIMWDAERPGTAIPARYLPSGTAGDATKLNGNMTGEWVGQLEYRDYQTNARVFLPTWLRMTPSADGAGVSLAYVYDDGPDKTVRESSELTFAVKDGTAMLGSGAERSSYKVTGLEEFAKVNRGTLVLTGPGRENDKPVDVRITLTLRRNLFILLKETRPVGVGEFQFRDQYTMTRAAAPAL